MSGHKPYKNLGDKIRATPEGRVAVERQGAIVRDMLALHKLREARGVTQVELAKAWETSQTNVLRVEHERDVYLSTLRAYVDALGGRLELRVVFPDQTITLGGISESSPAAPARTGQQIA